MAQRRFSSFSEIADAMFPSLSREAKQREQAQAKQEEEQKRRSRELAADLRRMNEKIRSERGR